jgi:hypothetical protein
MVEKYGEELPNKSNYTVKYRDKYLHCIKIDLSDEA